MTAPSTPATVAMLHELDDAAAPAPWAADEPSLEALLLAVRCGEISGITCDNVNGRNWFDARDAVLAKREGGR